MSYTIPTSHIVGYQKKWLSLNPKFSLRFEIKKFVCMILVSLIFSPKQTILLFSLFCHAQFPVFFIWTWIQHISRVCITDYCNFLSEANNFCLSLQIHFLILLSYMNCQYIVWSAISLTRKLFTGLHKVWSKKWIHASPNVVDISGTSYNIAFCFLISA